MRLKLYEDAIKAKAQKKAGRRNSRRSPTPQDEPTDADAEVEAPGEEPEGGGDLASRIYLREMTLMSYQHLQPKPELKWCRKC